MIDDVSDIAAYYNNDPEIERYRLEQNQLEYELTWRYLNQHLPSQGFILEIGAATGRYTLELAKHGYTITAVDFSAALIEQNRKSIANEGLERQVRFVIADARDLSEVTEKGFDAVLLMGPLYHLVVESDRKVALKGAFDRLREDGVIFSSFISRFGIMGDLIKDKPGWIEDQAEVRSHSASRADGQQYALPDVHRRADAGRRAERHAAPRGRHQERHCGLACAGRHPPGLRLG